MTFIRTFDGDIRPEELGFTYSHEHIVCIPPYWKERNDDDLLLDNENKSLQDVMDFKKAGGSAMVDATAVDYGRDVKAVKRISEKTGIKIIGTAGFNKAFLWNAKLKENVRAIVGDYKTYGEWIEEATVKQLADYVIGEIEHGLEGTNIRGGQLKFGTGYNSICPLEIKTIKAIAIAHKETRAPIHSHTEGGTMALEQMEILKNEGVKLEHVAFGHMDRNLDPYYHIQIAKTGAFLCFDGMGKIKYGPESDRINQIVYLVKQGYKDQILISGDTARKSYYKHYNHGLGLEYIIKKWVPRFMDEAQQVGLDEASLVKDLFINNPMRCFAFKH